MLDVNKLRKQFNEIRASLTKEDLQEWLDFAEKRELEDKLRQGETVSLEYDKLPIVSIKEKEIVVSGLSLVNSSDEYSIAA